MFEKFEKFEKFKHAISCSYEKVCASVLKNNKWISKYLLLLEKAPWKTCKPNIENIARTITIRNKTSENIINDLRIALTIVFKPN